MYICRYVDKYLENRSNIKQR